MEERDAPKQFIMGSMEEKICCLLNLAVFAELEGRQLGADLQARGEQFPFYGDPDGHRRVRAALDKVISKLS